MSELSPRLLRNDPRAAERDIERYAQQVRETLQQMSDEALAFQNTVVHGGVDRVELDRELARRSKLAYNLDNRREEDE